MTKWALGGVAGILFVVLSFVATSINVTPPAHTDDSATLARWFAEHSHRYRAGHLLAGFAFLVFWLPFFAALCERLRMEEGTPAIGTRVAWAAAILCPAAGTGSGMFIMGLAMSPDPATPDLLRFAMAANFYGFVVSGALGGVAMLAAGLVILRTGVFARWLGWTGMAIGAAAIISCSAILENDPDGPLAGVNGLAWLGFFLWILAVGVTLLRRQPD